MPFKWRQPATAPWHNRSTTKESGRGEGGGESGSSSAGESVGERQLRHFICAFAVAVARSVADAEACWCFYHLLSAACCSSCRCWGQRCRCCCCSALVLLLLLVPLPLPLPLPLLLLLLIHLALASCLLPVAIGYVLRHAGGESRGAYIRLRLSSRTRLLCTPRCLGICTRIFRLTTCPGVCF